MKNCFNRNECDEIEPPPPLLLRKTYSAIAALSSEFASMISISLLADAEDRKA
jgi:hypothetical protein